MIQRGHRFPELIAVHADDKDLILVEAHTRATAYILSHRSLPIEILAGSSLQIYDWAYV